jgi:hypothetical protein
VRSVVVPSNVTGFALRTERTRVSATEALAGHQVSNTKKVRSQERGGEGHKEDYAMKVRLSK